MEIIDLFEIILVPNSEVRVPIRPLPEELVFVNPVTTHPSSPTLRHAYDLARRLGQ